MMSENHNRVHGEHPQGDRGQIFFLLVFLMIWTLDSFIFTYSTFLQNTVPNYIRLAAVALLFSLAVILMRSGHRALSHEVQNSPRVLKDGAFAFVRHPLYLAALLFYVILISLTLSLISFGFFFLIFIFYNTIAGYEEKYLEKKFGPEYLKYRKEVPRWFPRLRKAK
jgi:protein-S-isoprenylcysteine O-methyltransferase Ste14